jgi:hypothetical protein
MKKCLSIRTITCCISLMLGYCLLLMNDRLDDIEITHEPIDFVISWVNGSDSTPGRYYPQPNKNRWRDWGELKYALRSIETNAPWFRTVYLVVNNDDPATLPSWLDLDQERLEVVPLWEIFQNPEADLPTANSNAVEVNLHRIKGLSRRFVYMNNDFFINKPISKSFFFYNRGQKVYFHVIKQPDMPTSPVPRDMAMAYNKRVLDEAFGRKLRMQELHAPIGLDRNVLREMEFVFGNMFNETSSHKIRSDTDVVLMFLYDHYAVEMGYGYSVNSPIWTTKNIIHFGLRDSLWRNRGYMALVRFANPVIFCINDDVKDTNLEPIIQSELTMFLEAQFPAPSMFER